MVEWKKLGEVCEYFRGRSLSKTDIGLGEAKVILYGELYTIYGDYITSVKSKTSTEKAKAATSIQTNDLLLPVSSTTKEAQIGKASVYLGNDNVSLGSDAIILRNAANSAYLMYYLNSLLFEKEKMSCVHGTTIMHLSPKELVDKKIPIPSLEEQTRIVGILDTFTSAIDNLKEQIAQRRKQYEYYRDQLLDLEGKSGVEMKTLPEISDNRDRVRKPITSSKRKAGNYPYYGASGIVDYVDGYIFDGDYLLISEDGANLVARSTPIAFSITGKNWVNNHAHVLQFKDKATQKYVEIYLNMIDLEPWINGAAQPKLNQDNLNKISIPLPPLSEQQRIVSILDTFEASIQNLEAQLKQREKQYEYYRNKLLTFE